MLELSYSYMVRHNQRVFYDCSREIILDSCITLGTQLYAANFRLCVSFQICHHLPRGYVPTVVVYGDWYHGGLVHTLGWFLASI